MISGSRLRESRDTRKTASPGFTGVRWGDDSCDVEIVISEDQGPIGIGAQGFLGRLQLFRCDLGLQTLRLVGGQPFLMREHITANGIHLALLLKQLGPLAKPRECSSRMVSKNALCVATSFCRRVIFS